MGQGRISWWAVRNWFSLVLFGAFDTPDNAQYRKDQKYFVLEGITGNLCGVLTAGVYLSGYALFLGASESLAGILVAMPMGMSVVQLFSAIYFSNKRRRKKTIVALVAVFRTLMPLTVLIPLVVPREWWVPVHVVLVTLAFGSMASFLPGLNNWVVSLVPIRIRGRFFAHRERVFQTVALCTSLLIGALVDALGRGYAAFVAVFAVAAIAGFGNLWVDAHMQEPPVALPEKRVSVWRQFGPMLRDKMFMNFVGIWMIWCFGFWIAWPFLTIYMINGLKLSYTFISIQNLSQMFTLVLTISLWGRVADKHSWDRELKYACFMFAAAMLLWVFVSSSTYLLLIPISMLMGFGLGGVNIGSFNSVAQLAPEASRTLYMGFHAALTGLCGFAGTVLGGLLSAWYASWLPSVPWLPLSHMQLLFVTSAVMLFIGLGWMAIRLRIKPACEEEKAGGEEKGQ